MKDIIEKSQHKTRIAVFQQYNSFQAFLLHVFQCSQFVCNICTQDDTIFWEDNSDYVLFFLEKVTEDIRFNIAFVDTTLQMDYPLLCQQMVDGGVMVLSNDHVVLQETAQLSSTFFRQLSFIENKTQLRIETDYGFLELGHLPKEVITQLDGLRLLCQQVGILEDQFYESLMSYNK